MEQFLELFLIDLLDVVLDNHASAENLDIDRRAPAVKGGRRTSVPSSEIQGDDSVGLLIRVIVVRPPERREVPAEVQFEVAPNTVTDVTNLRTARLRTGHGQQWKEQVVA